MDDNINFVQLPSNLDPYTPANPPPGWQLPPVILGAMAQLGIFLPRTAFTYLNLGPIRQKGVELSLDHRMNSAVSTFANYSWQGKPEALDDPNPYPAIELSLPPTHRFNVGGTLQRHPSARLAGRQLYRQGFLDRRAEQPVSRLHRRIHDGERQLRREMEQADHDDHQEHESC